MRVTPVRKNQVLPPGESDRKQALEVAKFRLIIEVSGNSVIPSSMVLTSSPLKSGCKYRTGKVQAGWLNLYSVNISCRASATASSIGLRDRKAAAKALIKL